MTVTKNDIKMAQDIVDLIGDSYYDQIGTILTVQMHRFKFVYNIETDTYGIRDENGDFHQFEKVD